MKYTIWGWLKVELNSVQFGKLDFPIETAILNLNVLNDVGKP